MKKFSNSNEPEFKKGLSEEEINSPEFNPDDFAPAPEKDRSQAVNEGLENKRNSLVFAFIATVLALIICFTGWGVTAAVSRYEAKALEKDVLSVFDNCDRIEAYAIDREGYDVYAVFFKNKMAGYAVMGTTEGFGGEIRFVVAFNSNNMISKIRVLDHNESMGLGSQIAKDTFLSQFKGILIGNTGASYDLVSGATTSSKALGDAILEILGLGLSTDSIAKELGYETISQEEIEEEIKKEEEDKNPTGETEPAETTGKPRPNGSGGGSNVNQGNGDDGMNIDGEDETTVYETETEEPDETTAETEEEETTKAPETTEKVEETTTAPEETTEAPEETTTAPEDTTGAPEDTSSPDDTTTEETTGAPDTEAVPANEEV